MKLVNVSSKQRTSSMRGLHAHAFGMALFSEGCNITQFKSVHLRAWIPIKRHTERFCFIRSVRFKGITGQLYDK